MSPSEKRMSEEHAWAEQALPWEINGSIGTADAARLAEHLQYCAQCRRELEIEQGIAQRLAAMPVVDYAPQASLARMMQKLDQAPRAASPAPGWRHELRQWWDAMRARTDAHPGLALAFAAQSLALALTVTWLVLRPVPTPAPEYRTLSSAAPVAAAQVQLVFADTATAAEMRAILDRVGGRIVGGPSRAGVFLVSLHASEASGVSLQQDVYAAVALFGSEPAVRYVAALPPVAAP